MYALIFSIPLTFQSDNCFINLLQVAYLLNYLVYLLQLFIMIVCIEINEYMTE